MRYYWIRWQEEGVLSPVPIAQQCVEEAQQKSLTGRAPSATCPRVCSEGKRGLLYNGLGDTVCHLPLGRSLERGSSCFPLSTLTFFFLYVCHCCLLTSSYTTALACGDSVTLASSLSSSIARILPSGSHFPLHSDCSLCLPYSSLRSPQDSLSPFLLISDQRGTPP